MCDSSDTLKDDMGSPQSRLQKGHRINQHKVRRFFFNIIFRKKELRWGYKREKFPQSNCVAIQAVIRMDKFQVKINQIICNGKFRSVEKLNKLRLNALLLDNKIEISCNTREVQNFQFYVRYNIQEIFHGNLANFLKEKLSEILKTKIVDINIKISNIHYSISYSSFLQRNIPNLLEQMQKNFEIEEFGIAQETNCSVPTNLSKFLKNPTHDFGRITFKCFSETPIFLCFQFNISKRETHLTLIASGHSPNISDLLDFLNEYGRLRTL